ncbi:MAG: SDR family NAD(P)-dependent oxidoreductase [Bacteroidales bacterium]|nr:SDR family NAD(P)-dependent oxidoreductase [Bacteroidales bacterium]MCF8386940.1 SDR family NAD(P)-dependent oxidoreductase [Bacteroidales bacterium]MCF8397445.1 SDR family NAD(P)-dependent oxidoreductase [Bacteroidales bacterium]
MKIFITGTSSGIGYGLAKKYLEDGHEVFGVSRSESEELNKFEKFHFIPQDLTDFKYAEINISNMHKKNEVIDLVILNAGILNEIKDMSQTTVEELKKSMDVNVWGNKVALDAALNMAEVKQVVAISTKAAVRGNRGWNAYAISKSAFKMMISLYAQEYPHTHFCSLAPGLIDTNMQDYLTNLPDDERFPSIDRLKAAKGTDKMPSPEEAADMLSEAIEKVRNHESGSFVDVREM